MKNRIILGLGFFWYIAGIACTVYLTAKLVDDFAFYQNLCPIPFVVVVIVGFLSCSSATGKLVIPLHFIYLKSLYWQKEYGGLPFTTYQQKIADANNIKDIFVATMLLSCWLFLPLLFYGMAYVCLNRYVCSQRPNRHDF